MVAAIRAPCSVFGEGHGEHVGEFQPGKVVTVCDHPGFLRGRETEGEVCREAGRVPFGGLIEGFGGNLVDFRKVGIQQHPLTAHGEDAGFQGGRNV